MTFTLHNRCFSHAVIILLILCSSSSSYSQTDSIPVKDSTQKESYFSGKIYLTNNGISPAPTFSLGRPALLFKLSLGRKRLTFDPDIRFSLDAKPWAFLLWWRYKAIIRDKYSMRFGIQPGILFRNIDVTHNGVEKNVLQGRRYLAGDHTQKFKISKHFKLGTYYFYSRSIDDTPKDTHFAVLTSAITDVKLFKGFYFHLFPQFYYLSVDELKGIYFSSSFSLTNKNFPISIEAIINQKIKTEILPEQTFVWNVSLVYSFNKKFVDAPVRI